MLKKLTKKELVVKNAGVAFSKDYSKPHLDHGCGMRSHSDPFDQFRQNIDNKASAGSPGPNSGYYN